MKDSSATSAKATGAEPSSGRSSAKLPTRTSVESFALSGPSDLPDPAYHAYRRDLADVALAGRVIASHYAAPINRTLSVSTLLRASPGADAEVVRDLRPNEVFLVLDDSLGWAWGYAGDERRVGYVSSDTLA